MARGRVAKGKKEAAAITDEAEDGQLAVLPAQPEAQPAGSPVDDHAILATGIDLERIAGLGRFNP